MESRAKLLGHPFGNTDEYTRSFMPVRTSGSLYPKAR